MVILRNIGLRLAVLLASVLAITLQSAEAGRALQGQVPSAARFQLPLGEASPQQGMQLAIGLPVRDPVGLAQFVKDVSDPTSPNFRQYLTPDQFTERFGPTQEEYDAVVNFAESRGLKVTALHANRMVVDVRGSVADVQRAFHIAIRNFRHPTEDRNFFAPDSDPVLDVPVPILSVSGLTNYWIPRPRMTKKPLGVFDNHASPKTGSAPDGTFRGNDFRAAYLPGVALTGAGQSLGLLEFDGYYPGDILLYEQQANLPGVPLQNVLVDGFSGSPGNGNGEASLDIQVAISMAPGLSRVIVYEAPNSSPWEDILNRMAIDNQAKQLSCSWGGGPPSPTAEQIFQQMAAQGQTFFNASGDNGAVLGGAAFPNDSPNIVQVGGTSLGTISPGGAWAGESVWNWGSTRTGVTASGGGFSSVYGIPSWQQAVSMATNQGSTVFRNFPDVALVADEIYNISDNGKSGSIGGTSSSAPLWAGFIALVNEQGASSGKPPVGFINPVVYQIGTSPGYSALFHDITSGSNATSQSGGRFSAVTGYDLCTGWGTVTPSLISALLSPSASVTTYTVTVTADVVTNGFAAGSGTYPAGAQATVTATAFPGWLFNGWTENGAVVSPSPTYTFTVNSDRNLVATFVVNPVQYTIYLFGVPLNGGFVSGGGTYPGNNTQFVFATPKKGYSFVAWFENNVPISTDAAYGFTLDRDRILIAEFVKGKIKKPGRGRRR